MRPLRRPTGDYLVFSGELVLYGDLEVGKSVTVGRDVPLDALGAMHVLEKARVVQSVVRGKETIRCVEVSAGEYLFEPPTYERLIPLW